MCKNQGGSGEHYAHPGEHHVVEIHDPGHHVVYVNDGPPAFPPAYPPGHGDFSYGNEGPPVFYGR